MTYTLIGSLRSPFVRTSRLFMLNNAIDFEFKVINYLEKKEDAEYLAQLSPINKIPVLMAGDEKIFDSRVIFNYLTRRHQLKTLTMAEENIQTAIQSCMDVSVNLLLLKMGGLNLENENWYIQRQRERIPLSMNFILPWLTSLDIKNKSDWNYQTMTLFSYLDWAHFRELPEIKDFPTLTDFVIKFKNAKFVRETDFRS